MILSLLCTIDDFSATGVLPIIGLRDNSRLNANVEERKDTIKKNRFKCFEDNDRNNPIKTHHCEIRLPHLERKTVSAQKRYMFFHDIYDRRRNDYMHDIERNRITDRHFGYEEEWTEK